jgi:hypothetical protein
MEFLTLYLVVVGLFLACLRNVENRGRVAFARMVNKFVEVCLNLYLVRISSIICQIFVNAYFLG